MIRRALRKAKTIAARLRYEPAYWLLRARCPEQYATFQALAPLFADQYRRIAAHDELPTTPLWTAFNTALEHSLLPQPPASFLRIPAIASTMVITKGGEILAEELARIQRLIPERQLSAMLREDPLGHPFIANWQYRTSHNSIHHAHHLARFFATTHADPRTIGHVVEWGGGYGNLAKIYRRFTAHPHRWTIIDTPLLCALQWLYLSSVLGPAHVQLITDPHQELLADGISLIPVQWFPHYALTADLFVSTWAISESPRSLQEEVATERRWFNARHLLIGYQESNDALPDAGHIEELARHSGAHIEDLPHMPRQHYAFK